MRGDDRKRGVLLLLESVSPFEIDRQARRGGAAIGELDAGVRALLRAVADLRKHGLALAAAQRPLVHHRGLLHHVGEQPLGIQVLAPERRAPGERDGEKRAGEPAHDETSQRARLGSFLRGGWIPRTQSAATIVLARMSKNAAW